MAGSKDSAMPKSLRDHFYEKHHGPPQKYESAVFWRCLHRHAIPLCILVYPFHRSCFRMDFELIQSLANTTTLSEFQNELEAYKWTNKLRGGTLRNSLRLRLSTNRLLNLYNELTTGAE